MDEEAYYEASRIYIELAKMGVKGAKEEAERGAKALMDKKEYYRASGIYIELAKITESYKGTKIDVKSIKDNIESLSEDEL